MNNIKCELCPRGCLALRKAGSLGICGETNDVRLARAALHFWEEPTISGESGSGTVFFSGCTLKCVYCQNADIARNKIGKVVNIERLAQIFIELQEKGANNINLVTPTHFAQQIISAIEIARSNNLHIPIVYNTSGYESVETIKLLSGYVDIFLTDFKYASSELAKKYSAAFNYPEVASAALDAMFELVGAVRLGEGDELMKRGIIVRHLLLPTHLDDSKRVIKLLSQKPYAKDIQLSIMNQYTPPQDIASKFPELALKVTDNDYDELLDYAVELGFEDSFCQVGDTAQESFIPAFDYEGV